MTEKIEDMPRHSKCIHYVPGDFSQIKAGHVHFCAPDAKTLGEAWEQKKEIDIQQCDGCQKYRCKYIEYPLTINGLDIKQPEAWGLSFEPVKIRLCRDDKTYFGILLGEFPWMTNASFNREDGKLKISTANNPCIYIPALKEIAFGCESWWSRLKPGEDVTDITDGDIENTWYVKLFRDMAGGKDHE